jgi:hypothetical protein
MSARLLRAEVPTPIRFLNTAALATPNPDRKPSFCFRFLVFRKELRHGEVVDLRVRFLEACKFSAFQTTLPGTKRLNVERAHQGTLGRRREHDGRDRLAICGRAIYGSQCLLEVSSGNYEVKVARAVEYVNGVAALSKEPGRVPPSLVRDYVDDCSFPRRALRSRKVGCLRAKQARLFVKAGTART